ncbi:MAG: hypothetical protein AAB369_01045, partial [Chloroflexota bacterium]
NRLAKLYDALETGEFQRQELAPRIRALLQKKEELQQARAEAEEATQRHALQLAEPRAVKSYVADLKEFLEGSGIVERKAFLKSFVDRIEVDKVEATVVYTLPILPDTPNGGREAVGVLPFVNDGPPLKVTQAYKSRMPSAPRASGRGVFFARGWCWLQQ